MFNDSNGFLTVIHMGDGVADEVGSVQTKDIGTTAAAGVIGGARRLAGKQGILGGEKIENFPVGAAPHSTEAWIRAEKSNGRALAWGNEHGQGKVVMHLMSPPHVKMECYFSGADVASEGRLPMNEWIHIFHTYEKGESRVSGRPEGPGQNLCQKITDGVTERIRLERACFLESGIKCPTEGLGQKSRHLFIDRP